MAERRKYPRIRAKFPCDLHLEGTSVKARIRDLSEGGLSVLTDLEGTEQGDTVRVMLHPPNRPSVEISCVFWHSRRVRVVGEDRSTAHLGLVLSNPSDAYFDLVSVLRGKPPTRPVDATEPAVKALAAPKAPPADDAGRGGGLAVAEPELQQYSVRVKQDGGPRSTRVVVAARNLRDAESRALAEVGEGWVALEVKHAKSSA